MAALAALVLAAPVMPVGPPRTAAGPPVAVIVRTVAGGGATAERAVERLGGRVGRRLAIIGGFTAEVPAARVVRLATTPGIAEVTPDAKGRLLGLFDADGPGTAPFETPVNLAAVIDANPAYARGITGRGVDVALIDSGVSPVNGLTTPGKVVNGPDLSLDSQSPSLAHLDGYGHGTHMAGLIAGRDNGGPNVPTGQAFTGVAPDARLVNIKVGSADGAVDVSQVIAALDWVVQHRNDEGLNIRVINLSYGTDSPQSYLVDPLAYAAEVAWRMGIVVVVSGGNDGRLSPTLADPAIDPYVIAVGADNPLDTVSPDDDVVAAFSSRGNAARHVDVVAPGQSMVSLRNPGSTIDVANPNAVVHDRFFLGSGTSQAAAVTSGAVALLLQARPWLTPDQVKGLLMTSASPVMPGHPVLTGAGLLDVSAAITTPAPAAPQTFPRSTGVGSLESARGTTHLVDATGVALTGEQDIFGQAFNSSRMALLEAFGMSWTGGIWNGSRWTGSSWTGSSWTASTWAGSRWSGSSWSGSSWSGSRWSGSSWSDGGWSGSSWSSAGWT
jgi:serine protease AprX